MADPRSLVIRTSIVLLVALAPAVARGDDQGAAAAIGFAGGGGWTPGGVRVDARYLLQLATADTLDIGAGFVRGSSAARCHLDSASDYACDHGLADGEGLLLGMGVRHTFATRCVQPFVRAAGSVEVVRFPDEVVVTMNDSAAMPAPMIGMTGVAIVATAAAGARLPIAPAWALTISAELSAGVAGFSGTADSQRLLGFAVTIGGEIWR